jgi:signal transduction histidine kinase
MDLFEPLILQQERQVELEIAPDITVWADETRLKQIVRNLIANALRYSPHKTPIRITAMVEPNQQMVRISVIDYGEGIQGVAPVPSLRT